MSINPKALRAELVAANLTHESFIASDGYRSVGIRTSEEAADAALAVVLAHLESEKAEAGWAAKLGDWWAAL